MQLALSFAHFIWLCQLDLIYGLKVPPEKCSCIAVGQEFKVNLSGEVCKSSKIADMCEEKVCFVLERNQATHTEQHVTVTYMSLQTSEEILENFWFSSSSFHSYF